MTISYTIEPSDFQRAVWVHIRPRRTLALVGAFLLVLVVAVLGIAIYRLIRTGQDLPIVLSLAFCLGYLCLYFFVLIPFKVRKLYQQQKLLHEPHTFEILETQLIATSPRGQSTLPWEVFHKWKLDKQLVLVYQSDALFHIFPRRAFQSAEEFQTFQAILRSKLGAPKS